MTEQDGFDRVRAVDLLWAFKRRCDAHSAQGMPMVHFRMLLSDPAYRQEMLTRAQGFDDEELLQLATQLAALPNDAVLADTRGTATGTARADTAQTWFSETMPTDISIGGHWVVRWRRGTRFRVDLYRHMKSGSLLPPDVGKSASSVACRVYDVAHGVTVQQVDCPKESLD
mgnify:CR=1 FL=1